MKNYKVLLENITGVHEKLQEHAVNSVNQSLTIRNWLIGFYIVEFEQNGKDRAEYGDKLLPSLAKELVDIKGIDLRALHNFKLFYRLYPQVKGFLEKDSIMGSLTPQLNLPFMGSLTPQFEKQGPEGFSVKKEEGNRVGGKSIITKLSYTHLELLFKINDDLKRTFYEIECIKATWSVREMKRQISSLYYERSGLSDKPEMLSELVNKNATPQKATDIIKNVYSFEFLDIKTKDVVEESDLETALLDQLQEFILEMGNGFCFEARQKRILIGEKYYFIDLVFYHRILKCHVLVDLKIGEFEHGDIGQLNTYVNYYKDKMIEQNDNATVGVLLVANKDHALVKYASAGMDENLFVQQYLVQLPSKEKLEAYINEELKYLTGND